MKNLKLISFLMILTLGLSSCSSNEDVYVQEESAKSLLKDYKLGKNEDGSYFIDYGLNGATSDVIRDETTSTNHIMLYDSNTNAQINQSEDLGFVGGTEELNINFNDTNRNKVTSISVRDNDIRLGKKENELLKKFDFTSNDDGTYNLDFTVVKDVEVEFVYNDTLQSYDILLSEGSSKKSNFLRTFTPDANGNLRIAFVTEADSSSRLLKERRPEIVVGG